MRALVSAALLLSANAARADVADDLAAKFAQFCMADSSPYKAANDAANAGKLEIDKGLTGVDTPTPSHMVTTQTWHAGELGGTPLSLVATNVDSGKCRLQACGVIAERLKVGGIEAALKTRLKLPDPTTRDASSGGIQSSWLLKEPADHVVAFAAQKSLAGDRVTLSVTQICPKS